MAKWKCDEKYKPVVFSISPSASDKRRISEYLSKTMVPYRSINNGLGIYASDHSDTLDQALLIFVQTHKRYKGPLVIVVNTHGTKANGNFDDSGTTVEPKNLWPLLDQPVKVYLEETEGIQRNVYLVMAQCYGKQFADSLKQVAGINDKVRIAGLSVCATFSEHNSDPNATIGSEAQHVELEEWMKEMFDGKEDEENAAYVPGQGGRNAVITSRGSWL